MILETSNPEFMTLLKTSVPKHEHLKVKLIDKDGQSFNRTLAWSIGEAIMVLGYRKKHYGSYVNWNYFKAVIVPEKKEKSENDKWIRSWTNVLNRLEKSGLWEDVAKDVRIALSVGMEKMQKAYKQYWEHDYSKTKELGEQDKSNAEKIKELDERLVGYRDDGTIYADTSIIWYMHNPAKVKKMRFGRKYINDKKLEAIAEALKNKQEFSEYADGRFINSYDIHFNYNPTSNKAWYSEEYRGCGNGHYYLALDATHALFYEDD